MRRHSRKKNSTKIFIAVTIVAALIFAASSYFMSTNNDVVIATVNNQKIFKSEVERKLRNVFEGQQGFGGQSQDVKIPELETLPKEVVEILVKEVYLDKELVKEAKKSKIANSKEIQDKVNDAKNKILRQAYIDSLVKSEVTDQKVSDKYAELSNELTGKKEYSISHIVTKSKEDAEKVLKELKAKKGPKFTEAAKKYSIDQDSAEKGGDLGYILEDNMIKEISDAIANLKQDEISNPIQTKFGWHLVKVVDIRDAKALPFEAVKDNIHDQLLQDTMNEVNSKITKDVKIKILITLKEPAEPKEEKAEEKKVEEQPAVEAEPAPELGLEKADPAAAKAEEKTEEEVAPEKSVDDAEKKVEEKSNEKQKSKKKSNR